MQRQSLNARAESVCQTRESATTTLAETIATDLTGLAESEIVSRWSILLQDLPFIMNEGWYQPPPKGLTVLIGNPPDYSRLRYKSLRDEMSWPRSDIRLTDDSLLFAYSSPVSRSTGMIGDLAISLYKGDDQHLQEHLSKAFDVTAQVAQFAAVGMEFREIYAYAADLIRKMTTDKTAFSLSNHTGVADVGHTAPWSFADYSSEAVKAFESEDITMIARSISGARLFISGTESQKIEPNMAFSIEPRIAHPVLPVACFHVWVAFCDGAKRICSGFGPLLQQYGMIEYLNAESVGVLS